MGDVKSDPGVTFKPELLRYFSAKNLQIILITYIFSSASEYTSVHCRMLCTKVIIS